MGGTGPGDAPGRVVGGEDGGDGADAGGLADGDDGGHHHQPRHRVQPCRPPRRRLRHGDGRRISRLRRCGSRFASRSLEQPTDALECAEVVGDELAGEVPGGLRQSTPDQPQFDPPQAMRFTLER